MYHSLLITWIELACIWYRSNWTENGDSNITIFRENEVKKFHLNKNVSKYNFAKHQQEMFT